MSTQANYDSTVNSFYLAFYGRPADPAGLSYWSAQLAAANGDATGIIDAFATSDEATARFGSETATQRVTDMYEQLFNRAPDVAGLAYWSDAVASGNVSLASVAITMLSGAQGSDTTLLALRAQAMDHFTAQVAASGTAYSGYAAITAASVLVGAVTLDSSAADIDALVKAAVSFADTATKTPAVVDALASGGTLAALYDTVRGGADPVGLTQTLAATALAAAGDPATLDQLLRGGGMAQVLKALPAGATLEDVVTALATGGLASAIEVVYPTATAPATTPIAFAFKSVTEGVLDTHHDNVTNVASADVVFNYTGTLASGQHLEYSLDGTNWITSGIDMSTANKTVTLHAVDLTNGAPPFDPFFNVLTVVSNLTTTIMVRAADANGVHTTALTQTIVYDNHVAAPTVNLDADTTRPGLENGSTDGVTSDSKYWVSSEQGATVKYLVGADWTTTAPALVEGVNTITVQQTDLAGNLSDTQKFVFTLDTKAPTVTESFSAVDGSGANPAVSDLATATVTFAFSGALAADDGFEYQIGKGAWTAVSTSNWDTKTDLLRIDGVDLSTSAQTVSVRAVDAAGNTGAVTSQLVDSSYHYEVSTLVGVGTPGGSSGLGNLTLTTKGDTIINDINTTDGFVNTDNLTLYSFADQNQKDPTNHAAGAILVGNQLQLAGSQALDAYHLTWGSDTFATNGASGHGYVAAGSMYLVGGSDAGLIIDATSFADSSLAPIKSDVTIADDATTRSIYVDQGIAAHIQTGGGMDVIIDNDESNITLAFDTLTPSAPDVMIGFDTGGDAIELNGAAAMKIDVNQDGQLTWQTAPSPSDKVVVAAGTEAVQIFTTGTIAIGTTTADAAATAATLNAALNINSLAEGSGGVLVLATDADHSVLFYVTNNDDNGVISADEVTVIAVTGQGEIAQNDIHLVGTQLPIPP